MLNNIYKYFYDDIAKPIKQEKKNITIEYNLDFFSFGKLNKNKYFYVIKRSPGAGMFSNLTFVMNHLLIAHNHNLIPVIDMENFPTIYNEKKKIDGTYNSWEYFFNPVSKYTLDEVYKSKNVFITSNRFLQIFTHNIYDQKFKQIRNKINIKNNLLKKINYFKNKHFKNKKVLGIHYRGTSYKTSANHPMPPTKIQMKNLIDEELKNKQYNKIFLATEDLEIFNFLRSIYKQKLIFLNNFRSKHDNAFKIYPRKKHRYLLGEEIIFESILLSHSNKFIFVQTNVSNFVRMINTKIKTRSIDNGLNSKNEYFAKYYWFIKNLLPETLGGFKKNI